MGISIYLRDDVQAMLVGLVVATVESALASKSPNWERLVGQLAGYRAVAHCVQVRWGDVLAESRAGLGTGVWGVLAEGVPSMIISGCVDRGG